MLKFLNKKQVTHWPLALLLVLSLIRFYKLDGGLVLGEPDEFIHQQVVESLKQSPWPTYAGSPWFFQLPLYPYLGFLLSFIFPQRYLALRIVSVLASILLTLGTYFFFRFKFGEKSAFFAALLLSLSPFSIYISRLALLDATAVSFGLLSLYALEAARSQGSLFWSSLAGLLLSLAVLSKYTAFIYVLVFASFFVFFLFKNNGIKNLREASIKIDLVSLLPLLILGLVILPSLYLMRQHDPYYFKLQLFTSLGILKDFWRVKGGELSIIHYLGDLGWWLTWPAIFLFLGGLFSFLKRLREMPVFWLAFLVTLVVVLPFRPFYPRYFYPLVPFIYIFAGLYLAKFVSRSTFTFSSIILVLTFLLMMPTSIEAFKSTNHRLVEATGDYLKEQALVSPWVFSNYWPNVFGQAIGTTKATWMTDSLWDARAFVADLPGSPMEILAKEGGIVLLEKNYSVSKIFIHPEERTRSWRVVSQRPLDKIIDDDSPNFPHFRQSLNSVSVYRY